MESDNLSCEQVSSALTSAGIGNHAVRPQNGRLFPLTAISDHEKEQIKGRRECPFSIPRYNLLL